MKPWNRIISFISWHRRAVAALCAALCVAGIVSVAQAPPPPGDFVVAPLQPLPAGHVVTAEDLGEVEVARATDSNVLNPEDAIGKRTAVALDAGQPLTSQLLMHPGSTTEGRALVPVQMPDQEMRSVLEPGTRVSLIVVLGEGPEVLTDDARVASLPTDDGSSRQGAMLVDVPSEVAPIVATLGQSGQLSFILGSLERA